MKVILIRNIPICLSVLLEYDVILFHGLFQCILLLLGCLLLHLQLGQFAAQHLNLLAQSAFASLCLLLLGLIGITLANLQLKFG